MEGKVNEEKKKQIMRMLENMFDSDKETPENQEAVVFVGPPGSGKSTLINGLLGIGLKGKEVDGKLRIDKEISSIAGPKIKHGADELKKYEINVHTRGKVDFWEYPGFDKEDIIYEIYQRGIHEKFLKNYKSVRIVLVVPYYWFEKDTTKLFETLRKSLRFLMSCIVVTKCHEVGNYDLPAEIRGNIKKIEFKAPTDFENIVFPNELRDFISSSYISQPKSRSYFAYPVFRVRYMLQALFDEYYKDLTNELNRFCVKIDDTSKIDYYLHYNDAKSTKEMLKQLCQTRSFESFLAKAKEINFKDQTLNRKIGTFLFVEKIYRQQWILDKGSKEMDILKEVEFALGKAILRYIDPDSNVDEIKNYMKNINNLEREIWEMTENKN